MRFLKRITKGILLFVAGFVLLNLFLSFVLVPVYDFPEPKPFSGGKWFNPYAGLDSSQWKKANFQVQSDCWGYFANGMHNTPQDVFDLYNSLNYDIITISDYMSINRFETEKHPLISIYEHGYGIQKTHQLNIGTDEVLILDYPLFQTRNTKQHILSKLNASGKLVTVAHPGLRSAYSHEDLAHLTHYQCLEVLNNLQESLSHWDAALSAGKPIFIMANDDAHDLRNQYDYGKMLTALNLSEISEDNVVEAFRNGRSYGLKLFSPDADGHDYKRDRFKDVPELLSMEIQGEEVIVTMDRPLSTARLIGENGKELNSFTPSSPTKEIRFKLDLNQPYVRIEVDVDPGHTFYTNPIFQTTDGKLPSEKFAEINWLKTVLYRGAALAILVFVIRRFLFSRKKKLA